MNRTTLSSLALAALALPTLAQASGSTTPTAVKMTVPSAVRGAKLVAPLPASTVLSGSISLMPANRAAFKAYADAVSNPKSPTYRRFLGPAAIGARFGGSASTVSAVVSYLKSKGLTVTMTSDTRLAILFKGKVSAIDSAFSTTLNKYHLAERTDGGPADFYSYATVPKVPASFAAQVVSIGGIQNAYPRTPLALLTPAQSRGLYGAAGLYAAGNKGKGVTVGITNLGDGYRLSNLPVFYSDYSLPTPSGGIGSNVQKVAVAGTDGNTQTEGIETNLDIQMVLAEAPFATVIVYDGWTDLTSIAAREVQDNLIDIASESWVWYDATDVMEAMNDEHLAMTVEGITYMAGTGDWGADESRGNYPHAYPDVLAIGGTDATVSDAFGTRSEEHGWYYSGAGWEPTAYSFNSRPSYQNGSGLPTGLDKRLFPDVSLQAAGSWMVAGGAPVGVGGTSSSGPQFAGQVALILETLKTEQAVDPIGGKYRLGRINDFVYSLAGSPTAFYDITTGDAENLLPDGTTASSTVGWDYVTGWGAPIAQGLHDGLLALATVALSDPATGVGLYTLNSPSLTLGTNVDGGVASLPTADGVTYSVQSVRQNGVGQVAGVTIDIALQTAKVRHAATLQAMVQIPTKATSTLYLLNRTTGAYDLVETVAGTGAMASASIPIALDDQGGSPYIDASTGKLTLLVRALKPTRLGTDPFRLVVDQAIVVEKVSRG